jgi:hypothetical protein
MGFSVSMFGFMAGQRKVFGSGGEAIGFITFFAFRVFFGPKHAVGHDVAHTRPEATVEALVEVV